MKNNISKKQLREFGLLVGFGFPFCGLGVTVPTSRNPMPNDAKLSMYSPFLSKPAAIPTLLAKLKKLSFERLFCSFFFFVIIEVIPKK